MGITIAYRGQLADLARGWICSCSWTRSFATRTRGLLLHSARSIEAPATPLAAWRGRCAVVTKTPRIMACASTICKGAVPTPWDWI